MSNQLVEYTADDIATYEGLAHIRARPSAYVGSRGTDGIVHTLWEILSNSVDELILQPDGGVIHIAVLCDYTTNTFQVLVHDTGRGIPASRLLATTTKIGTSGKINSKAYVASGGQFGIGAKVAAALSTRYRIISHNYQEMMTSSLYLENGEVSDHHDEVIPEASSGVITVTELDANTYFNGGTEFMSGGYLDLCNICRELNIFNERLNFQFYLYDRQLPNEFWQQRTDEALKTVYRYLYEIPHQVIYASDQVSDKASYLFELWTMRSHIVNQARFDKEPTSPEDRLGFNIKIYFTKRSATGNPQYFVTVNNVELKDKTENSATVTFLKVLSEKIVRYLDAENLRNFVTNEYRFNTMLLALGIRYHGAELSGVTKNSFKDQIFAAQFYQELTALFNSYPEEFWVHFVNLIKPDIESRYAQTYDAPVSKNEGRKVFLTLNFDKNYKECEGTDHDELYIVEGRSAGGITTARDASFQAVYTTRGKPVNVATASDHISANRQRLVNDEIYSDLIKILNITPHTTNMESARYKKIIIATDADPDGYHIASLHINNLYILNPRIIESGMVWWANPPLYCMEFAKTKLFVRDEAAYEEALIEYAYKPALKLEIVRAGQIVEPDRELERDIYYLVDYIGEKFTQVGKQLNIPVDILEVLTKMINAIYPKINYQVLEDTFKAMDKGSGRIRLQCFPEGEYIVLSVGDEDYPIALRTAGQAIVNHLWSDIIKYKTNDVSYLVTSKFRGGTLNRTPVTTMELYKGLQNLKNLFTVTRYKGLGKMSEQDCAATIMNPETRSLTRITSIGDWLYNYSLLGKDSTERKRLLTGTNTLSNTFTRQNFIF